MAIRKLIASALLIALAFFASPLNRDITADYLTEGSIDLANSAFDGFMEAAVANGSEGSAGELAFMVYAWLYDGFAPGNTAPKYANRADFICEGSNPTRCAISSVQVDGKKASWESRGVFLTVRLPEPLAPGATTKIRMYFKVAYGRCYSGPAAWGGTIASFLWHPELARYEGSLPVLDDGAPLSKYPFRTARRAFRYRIGEKGEFASSIAYRIEGERDERVASGEADLAPADSWLLSAELERRTIQTEGPTFEVFSSIKGRMEALGRILPALEKHFRELSGFSPKGNVIVADSPLAQGSENFAFAEYSYPGMIAFSSEGQIGDFLDRVIQPYFYWYVAYAVAKQWPLACLDITRKGDRWIENALAYGLARSTRAAGICVGESAAAKVFESVLSDEASSSIVAKLLNDDPPMGSDPARFPAGFELEARYRGWDDLEPLVREGGEKSFFAAMGSLASSEDRDYDALQATLGRIPPLERDGRSGVAGERGEEKGASRIRRPAFFPFDGFAYRFDRLNVALYPALWYDDAAISAHGSNEGLVYGGGFAAAIGLDGYMNVYGMTSKEGSIFGSLSASTLLPLRGLSAKVGVGIDPIAITGSGNLSYSTKGLLDRRDYLPNQIFSASAKAGTYRSATGKSAFVGNAVSFGLGYELDNSRSSNPFLNLNVALSGELAPGTFSDAAFVRSYVRYKQKFSLPGTLVSLSLAAFYGDYRPLSGTGPNDGLFSTNVDGFSIAYSQDAERLLSLSAELRLVVPYLFFSASVPDPSPGQGISPLMEAGLRLPLSLGPYIGRIGLVFWASDERAAGRALSGDPSQILKWITFDIAIAKP